MRRKEKWNQKNIWTFSRLSDDEPILYGFKTYNDITTPNYDMHYGMEMGIIRSGKMRRFYENSSNDLISGDVWFCGMWEPHGYEILETPCEVITVIILPQMLANLHFNEASKINWLTPFIIPAEQRPKIGEKTKSVLLEIAYRLEESMNRKSKLSKLRLRLYVLEILTEIQEIFPFRTAWEAPDSTTYSCVNHAIHTLFKNHRKVTTSQLARDCCVSRNLFNSLFKKTMGISFAKFSLRYRLNGVASQLIHSDDPLKMIADEWGFTDASHLIRNFVKHYSITPTEYRKRNKQ